MRFKISVFIFVLIAFGLAEFAAGQALRVLWIGNSYTAGQPQSIADMIVASGEPAPTMHSDVIGGATIATRASSPAVMTGILAGVPQPIDVVVLQGQSLEATSTFSNPAAFIADIQTVFQAVRNHSPNARAVLYQTWARGPGHGVYTQGFVADPAALHAEIRGTYTAARDNLNAVFGVDTARLARVGDAFAEGGWLPSFYVADLSHPSTIGFVLASMSLYEAVTESEAGEIAVDFGPPGDPFANQLSASGISEALWYQLLGLTDAVAPRYPGSRDDLLLSVSVNGLSSTYPVRFAMTGDLVQVQSTSPGQLYAGLPYVLAVQPSTGPLAGPGHGFAELVFDLTPNLLSYGPVALPITGLDINETIPAGLAGTRVYLQGVSVAPSAVQMNPFFTATNAIEVRFL